MGIHIPASLETHLQLPNFAPPSRNPELDGPNRIPIHLCPQILDGRGCHTEGFPISATSVSSSMGSGKAEVTKTTQPDSQPSETSGRQLLSALNLLSVLVGVELSCICRAGSSKFEFPPSQVLQTSENATGTVPNIPGSDLYPHLASTFDLCALNLLHVDFNPNLWR